nr:MAG TPA: hypothetical protein [Caudoviricetes sp.]
MAILTEIEITPRDFVEMYTDLEIVELCEEHGKIDDLIEYIRDMYGLGEDIQSEDVYDSLERGLEEIKAEFGIV